MKVIICGSQIVTLEPEVIADIVHISCFKVTTLICGMAIGVDMSAFRWAQENGIKIIQMPFKKNLGILGGFERNQDMVDIADAWIGIIDNRFTPGTKDCYNRAKKAKIPTFLYNMGGIL